MKSIKKKVEFSGTSIAITIAIIVFYVVAIVYFIYRDRMLTMYLLAGALVVYSAMALFYAPTWISVSDNKLNIGRSLRIKEIPMDEIASVERTLPSVGGVKRLFGSGGYLGYWGWFSSSKDGRYFAYYGRPSDCFIIVLRDGRKYMLGCNDSQEIVGAISEHIKERKMSNGFL